MALLKLKPILIQVLSTPFNGRALPLSKAASGPLGKCSGSTRIWWPSISLRAVITRCGGLCAAGTGRFLELASRLTDTALDDLGARALSAEAAAEISSMCVVFAESEILSWLGKGRKVEDILLGVHQSIAGRSTALLRRVGCDVTVADNGAQVIYGPHANTTGSTIAGW